MSAVSSSVTPTSWAASRISLDAVLVDAAAEGVGADADRADHESRAAEGAVGHVHGSTLRAPAVRIALALGVGPCSPTPSSSTGAAPSPGGTTSTSTRSRWPSRTRWSSPSTRVDVHADALQRANQVVWGRSRDHQQSATVADLFTEAGLAHDPELLVTTASSGSRTPPTDPQVAPLFAHAARARDQGRRAVQHDLAARLARGLLRARRRARPDRRRRLHQRDPVDQAGARGLRRRDGGGRRRATRPAASTSATGSSTTSGARTTPACKAIHIPHSDIPVEQVGHSEGEPDAVAHELTDIPGLLDRL